ncbi:MAG: hypothetical protein ACKVVT_18965 [Dehalococcoidia bacterium]
MRARLRLIAGLSLAGLGMSVAAAQSGPPFPDFFWPYGTVQADGENLSPPLQPVVALINGRACGQAETRVAEAIPANPIADVGKTVFAITVLADGSGNGQRPGCGHLGDRVVFWLPLMRAFASQQPLFAAGPNRIDLTLDPPLVTRVALPFVAGDAP